MMTPVVKFGLERLSLDRGKDRADDITNEAVSIHFFYLGADLRNY